MFEGCGRFLGQDFGANHPEIEDFPLPNFFGYQRVPSGELT